VEEGGAERLGVQAHAGADPGDADRVRDELVTGLALLVAVALTGEDEGALDLAAVDRPAVASGRSELLDQREEVAEQRTLLVGQVAGEIVDGRGACAVAGRADLGMAATVGGDPGTVAVNRRGVAGRTRVAGRAGVGQGCVRLSRYRSASSCRAR